VTPEPCHYDRALRRRVTRRHQPDCATNTCEGCEPCPHDHCLVCRTRHTTREHPDTCPRCIHTIRDDLTDLRVCYRDLHREALDAGHDGRLAAAAPIPGATPAVLIGPTVRLDLLRTTSLEDHHRSDPIPPLAILAQWEAIYRTWLDHQPDRRRRPTIGSAIDYLTTQLDYLANHAGAPGAPDWVAFTRQIRDLRSRLEAQLHNERDPELGVECFNCGDRLVRRFRDPLRCRHDTDARLALRAALVARAAGQDWLRVLRTYPELGPPRTTELTVLTVPAELLTEARRPCEDCAAVGQGGIDDPAVGQSWECPGCRKQYDPGEYARAVRLSLSNDEHGWATVAAAAAALSGLTGRRFAETTVRAWVARGWVGSKRDVRDDGQPGALMVRWHEARQEALRVAAGRYHCKHRTGARTWLRTLQTYPELEPSERELEAAREQCDDCRRAVEAVRRHAHGNVVA